MNTYRMTRHARYFLLMALCALAQMANAAYEGKCGDKMKWVCNGSRLEITYTGSDGKPGIMNDYDSKKNQAPWIAKGLSRDITSITIGEGVEHIGSFAFNGCKSVTSIDIKGNTLKSIGSGAFYGCTELANFYFPISVELIERIAFAQCENLSSVVLPDNCIVEEDAFRSCKGITYMKIPETVKLGARAFISEVKVEDETRFAVYDGKIDQLPSWINEGNCVKYGISKDAYKRYYAQIHPETLTPGGGNVARQETPTALSDVDQDVPETGNRMTDTYALIIGNEKYKKVGGVPFAVSDARSFNNYCIKTLGIPSQNIHKVENATMGDMKDEIAWIRKAVQSKADYNEAANVIVYYAGHGVPNEETHDAFLLPVDGNGTNTEIAISLKEFYDQLNEMPADRITVFLDACFSGSNRNNEQINKDRGVVIKPRPVEVSGNNMVVFSATQGDQTAQAYDEKNHGTFTYFLLKKLQETEGNVSYGELSSYLEKNVRQRSISLGKEQTPTTKPSESLKDKWQRLRF